MPFEGRRLADGRQAGGEETTRGGDGVRVLMWEGKGDADGLVAWWRDVVGPGLPDGVSVELFRSADRVVALVRLGGGAGHPGEPEEPEEPEEPRETGLESRLRLPEPPGDLVARPPHVWPFETVE